MKMFKKGLALALAGTMTLSSMTAFAAESVNYAKEGDALYELGLLKGYSTTEKQLGLDDELTREQAMKLIVDMMGWDVDMSATSDFSDVATWAQPYVAVAVENGITNGMGEVFGGSEVATMHQLTTWYLRALGHGTSEAWDNAVTLGLENELVTPAELVAFEEDIQRDELAGVAYKALSTTKVGSKETLLAELVAEGVVEEATAVELGLIKVVEENLEVAGVEALNLVQTEVKFNKAVKEDSAEDKDNYSVGKKTIVKAELAEDGMTVVLTHDKVDNQDSVDVEVEDVKSADDSEKVADFKAEVEFLDFSIPEVVSVEVIGNQELLVTFNEPVAVDASGDAITVKDADSNKKLYVDKAEQEDKSNQATVKIYGKFEEGDYEVSIAGSDAQDFAGYSVKPFNEVIEVAKDEEAPEVVAYEDVEATKVTLVFDEQLDDTKTVSINDVYHTNAKNKAKTVKLEGNKMIITFDEDDSLPAGTAYITVASDDVMDNWGNVAGTIIETIEREVDETAPVIEKVDAPTEKSIKITFDENVKYKTAKDDDNYTVLDSEGEEVDVKSIVAKDDNVTLNFKNDLSGVYEVKVKDVEDMSGNKADDMVEVDVTDVTAPEFKSATFYATNSKEHTLIIRFSEDMSTEGQYSVLDLDKYVVGTEVLADVDDVEIDLIDGGKAVEIVFPADTAIAAGDQINIAKVADEKGNASDGLLIATNETIINGDTEKVNVASVEVKAVDTVVVTFTDELSVVKADEFVISNAGGSLDIASYEVGEKDGDTTITFTLSNDDKLTSTAVTDIKLTLNGSDSQNEFGQKVALTDIYDADGDNNKDEAVAQIMAADKVAPTVKLDGDDKAVVTVKKDTVVEKSDTQEIVVTVDLTEDLKAGISEALASTDLVVMADSEELVYGATKDYTLDLGTPGKAIFTIVNTDTTKDVFANPDNYEINIQSKDTVNYIVDAKDNKLADVDVSVDLDDVEEYKYVDVASATVVANDAAQKVTVTVTYTEEVVVATSKAALSAKINGSAASNPVVTTVTADTNAKVVVYEIAFDETLASNNTVEVSVDPTQVTDVDESEAGAAAATTVTVTVQ